MSEALSLGVALVSIGHLVIYLVIAALIWQIVRLWKTMAASSEKYWLLEDLTLEKYAKDRGIDLKQEAIERELYKKKSFRRLVEEELISEYLKDKKEKKPE